ncbi:hypothetical protein K474DRAFT_1606810 [Panus rudis PR-1116 ss-1]|nr:hypothetical protein K474DRAFT_1606810 [Panus rudis PR-1116 ss-1]
MSDGSTSVHLTSEPGLRFQRLLGCNVTEEQLRACAKLFSENYGVWGADASPRLTPGSRIRMSPRKLRSECLSDPARTLLVICTCDGRPDHIGHAFATVWTCNGESIGWITQLVVHKDFRRQYIATTLVQTLKRQELFGRATIVGVISSHPATCNVVAKLTRLNVTEVDLSFIAEHAQRILSCSPVPYLRAARLHGSLFQEHCTSGAVSTVDTEFPLDHEEPLDALKEIEKTYGAPWKLGTLPAGHEFLAMYHLVVRHGAA